MKLISLNTYGGRFFNPLSEFIKFHSQSTDIFCLQEVFSTNSSHTQFPEYRANLLQEISSLLPNFTYFFDPVYEKADTRANSVRFDLKHGLAIFVKKEINILGYKSYFIYRDKVVNSIKKDYSDIPVNIQLLSFLSSNKTYTLANFHGASYPGSKLDTLKRLKQSEKIVEIFKKAAGAKILTGDFNLLPNTKSIKMIENSMINLISEFNIKRTRSNLSPFFETPDFQKFADYTFVSKNITVENFKVPEVKISDHLPMILEFD